MFEQIKQDLAERMQGQTDSRCASGDEVRIAWLVIEIESLQAENARLRTENVESRQYILDEFGKQNTRLQGAIDELLKPRPDESENERLFEDHAKNTILRNKNITLERELREAKAENARLRRLLKELHTGEETRQEKSEEVEPPPVVVAEDDAAKQAAFDLFWINFHKKQQSEKAEPQ